MERFIQVDHKDLELFERKEEMSKLLGFVDSSRQKNPNPKIISYLKGFHEKEGASFVDERVSVDEFVIRLLASSENGLSLFDLAALAERGVNPEERTKMEPIIIHEMWNLEDIGILVKNPRRFLTLSPDVKEQFK